MPDLFPTTARTWIDEQFATIELGGDAAADARVRLRSHVMERYARPLSAYVRATSIARALLLDADDVVHDFLAHRVSRDGFFERYRKLKIIGAHAGGALPFLISRFDRCYDMIGPARETISVPPSSFMDRLYLDAVVFTPEALAMAVNVVGEGNVMYGSDYPHNIGDMPGCLARVDALPGAQKDKVRGRNAERIFNL